MKAIIFGINGQDGYYLSKLLNDNGIDFIGVSRSDGDWERGDVSDFVFIENLIKRESPDYIFHFAANSTANHSVVLENHKSISDGSLNILESVLRHSKKTKIFLSGSALQFQNNGSPINEKTPFDWNSLYAVERIYSTFLARYYRKLGISVYIGYLFNHDSPLRTERHINKKITTFVKRAKDGSRDKLVIGDMNVKKEFNYAGDIVNAIWLLVNQNNFFEAVIGSGKSYSIREWIEYCFSKEGLNYVDFIEKNTNYVSEYSVLVSDPSLIMSLGWSPSVDFYQLADMMMES